VCYGCLLGSDDDDTRARLKDLTLKRRAMHHALTSGLSTQNHLAETIGSYHTHRVFTLSLTVMFQAFHFLLLEKCSTFSRPKVTSPRRLARVPQNTPGVARFPSLPSKKARSMMKCSRLYVTLCCTSVITYVLR